MRIRLAVPPDLTPDEQRVALDAALASVMASAQPAIERGKVPLFARAVRDGRVRWRPEPPGDEHFDLPQTVLRRGWGDCDDLAPWHAASLRAAGADPGATPIVRRSGPNRWHAVVRRSDGSIDDPSVTAGMRSIVSGPAGCGYAPVWAPMAWRGDQPAHAIAAHPWRGQWVARADLPLADYPVAVSGICVHGRRERAVCGAVRAASDVAGDAADDLAQLRAAAVHDVLAGVPVEAVLAALDADGYDAGEVGFLPFAAALAPGALQIASKLPGVSSLFAGGGKGGGAVAPAAAPMGAPMGAPGTTVHVPGGPIIVRF